MPELLKRAHPALVHFPITLYPVSLIFLLFYWLTHNPLLLGSSYLSYLLAVLFVIPTALTGLWDMKRLRNVPRAGHRHLRVHFLNGVMITVLSLITGFFFIWQPPYASVGYFMFYNTTILILTSMVLFQGYLGARMVYQDRLGVEGATR